MRLMSASIVAGLASVFCASVASAAVIITPNDGATAIISATDSLEGLTAAANLAGENDSQPVSILTNGLADGGGVYSVPRSSVETFTFDLGATDQATRQLDNASICMIGKAGDFYRDAYQVQLYTSLDNVTFTPIAGTSVTGGPQAGAGTAYRNLDYTFAPGDVVGLRYLQFAFTPQSGSQGVVLHPRTIELDANVSVPEPASLGLLSLAGMALLRRRR